MEKKLTKLEDEKRKLLQALEGEKKRGQRSRGPEVIQTPPTPPPNRSTHTATANVSPILNYSSLTAEQTNKIKKVKANDRTQYVCGCMDVVFSKHEMASSNLGGKRQKESLDEGRADLVKRKYD